MADSVLKPWLSHGLAMAKPWLSHGLAMAYALRLASKFDDQSNNNYDNNKTNSAGGI